MMIAGINIVAVVAAAAASFVFGSVYYMVLAKSWRQALGKTEAEVKANMTAVPFITAAVAQLVMAFMLASLFLHVGDDSLVSGLVTATPIWLGFVMTTMAVNHAFQGAKFSLTVIDGGHWLGVLAIQGVVLGFFA